MCAICGSVCVRALLCLVFIIAAHLGNNVIFYQLSPLTLHVTVNSYNATQTIIKSLSAGDCIDWRNKSQKYRRRLGANPSPLALHVSALATWPPWIDELQPVWCHSQWLSSWGSVKIAWGRIQPPSYQLFQVLHGLNVMYILGAPHIILTYWTLMEWTENQLSM